MPPLDKRRRGELLRGVFDVLADHPDGIQAKDALAELEHRIELTDHEKANYPDSTVRRFEKTVRFQTINAVKAGWMTKEAGISAPAKEGLSAHQTVVDPEQFMDEAGKLYQEWPRLSPQRMPRRYRTREKNSPTRR